MKRKPLPIWIFWFFLFFLPWNVQAAEEIKGQYGRGEETKEEIQKCKDLIHSDFSQGETLIGYSKGKAFYALLRFKEGKLIKSTGQELEKISELYPIQEGKPYKVSFGMGIDHRVESCIWFSKFEPKSRDIRNFTLLASKKTIDIRENLSKKEREVFYGNNKTCVDQGDPQPEKKQPCTKPKLIAISDLNQNGQKEYWYSDPYMWDTGFTVAEFNEKTSKFEILVRDCSFCSD